MVVPQRTKQNKTKQNKTKQNIALPYDPEILLLVEYIQKNLKQGLGQMLV